MDGKLVAVPALSFLSPDLNEDGIVKGLTAILPP
jgi:hypothetical protein